MSFPFFYPQELPIEHLEQLAELLRDTESSPWHIMRTASTCVGFLAEYYDGHEIPPPVPGVSCESLSRQQLADEVEKYALGAHKMLSDSDSHEIGSPELIRGVLPLLAWVIESMVESR